MKNNTELRRLRESYRLSQIDLAELLDVSQGRISRYESGDEYPTFPIALAYFAVFGRPPHRSFPDLYASVEDGVMARGAKLERSLRDKHDSDAVRKRAMLERMMNRACSRPGA